MNIQVFWAAIQPFLTQLLQSPQFQAVVKKILDDIMAKIADGVHPNTAVQQATGQIGAAALLHLTGNPAADFAALISNLKPPTGSPVPPPGPGTYTS
jgi:hypothetical protein